jgi:hypothetical protein
MQLDDVADSTKFITCASTPATEFSGKKCSHDTSGELKRSNKLQSSMLHVLSQFKPISIHRFHDRQLTARDYPKFKHRCIDGSQDSHTDFVRDEQA